MIHANRFTMLQAALCLMMTCHAWAADRVVPEGETLIDPAVLRVEQTTTGDEADPTGKVSMLPSDSASAPVLRLETLRPESDYWRLQSFTRLNKAIAAGDTLLIRFHARGSGENDESGNAKLNVAIKQHNEPWHEVYLRDLWIGSGWQEYSLPLASDASYASDELSLVLGFGFGKQWVEVKDIELVYYGRAVALDQLPKTRLSYAGREADAPWRAKAAARIEAHRKKDVVVTVVDGAGMPVPGATVRARLARHAFRFGSLVRLREALDPDPACARFRDVFPTLFNTAVVSTFKWDAWSGDWGPAYLPDRTIATLKWLKSRDIYIRGHVLIWPGEQYLPKHINALLAQGSEDIPALALEHIRDCMARAADLVDEWDVINEPRVNHLLMDRFGDGVVDDWFREARSGDPEAPLYVNEYEIVSGGGINFPKHDEYAVFIERRMAAGAPLSGIGIQGHIGRDLTSPEKVMAVLERFGGYGLPVTITEFDLQTEGDWELQADYTRDFLTAAFASPQVEGVLAWGFWSDQDRDQDWFSPDWQARPVVQAYKDLVFREWSTEVSGQTGTDGSYAFRGFMGTYDVIVDVPGRQTTTSHSTSAPDWRIDLE